METKRDFWTIIFVGEEREAGYLHVWSTEESAQAIATMIFEYKEINQGKHIWNEFSRQGDTYFFAPKKFKLYNGWLKIGDNIEKLAAETRGNEP